MGTCMYCRSTDGPFHREHVMPQAFGTFEPESPILRDCVCVQCNNFFGGALEMPLSRDSLEAVLRLRYGLKPASEWKDLRYKQLKLKVLEPGPWAGATVILEADRTGNGIEPVPVAQAGFCWTGSSTWDWVLEEEMNAERVAPYRDAQGKLGIRVCGPSATDHKRLIETLARCGIKFVKQGDLQAPITTDGTVGIQIETEIDSAIFRAVAKIAFNYVAWAHGSEFVLRSDFDDARHYIRRGKEPLLRVVKPDKNPILSNDSRHFRQTNGHLVVFDWNYSQRGLLARVSLFNTMTYLVLLCPDYSGIWRDNLRTGHHFDIESRTVAPIQSTSLIPVVLRASYLAGKQAGLIAARRRDG